MLTEDYIMRLISMALAVLMTALGLKRAKKYKEALQTFDQALEILLGLPPRLVYALDDKALLDKLTFNGKLDVERLLVVADIYREEAEVFELQGRPADSTFAGQRSLRLYLEAALDSEANSTAELIRKIESLRLKLTTATLPIETRLALLDYFERLLASGDDFLAEAGLSRQDLQAAFNSLNNANQF